MFLDVLGIQGTRGKATRVIKNVRKRKKDTSNFNFKSY